MKQPISKCPDCQGALHIATLRCPDCGLELKSEFALGAFDRLSQAQHSFLLSFLKNRGSLKDVQADLQMSYPTARKKLDELLTALNLMDTNQKEASKEIDMSNLKVDYTSNKASEIIKVKLKENGGHVTVYTINGLPCEIYAEPDGVSFTSNKLQPSYEYTIFDVIVDLLQSQGGRAQKGYGRNYKMGDPNCDETTVVGAVAKYRGSKIGDSVYDPVFVLAAVLDWAGIASNERGYLQLNASFMPK